MTTIITADLHLAEGVRDRYRLDFQKRLRSAITRRNADCLVILGDLTEAKDRHSSWLVNQVVDALHALAQLCPVLILQGNHDYKDEEWPFFRFVDKLNGVMWLSEVEFMDKETDGFPPELGRTLFLPHTNDHKRDWKGIDFKSADTIFAHNTFEGADAGFGRILRGIPIDVFPKDATVYSGDIHVPQELGPVTYVGSPYTVDFGDSFKPRYLMIEDNGNVKSIGCGGPQKRVFDINSPSDLETVEVGQGDIVRVRVHLASRDGDKWIKEYAKIRAWADEAGVMLTNVMPVTTALEKSKRVRGNSDVERQRKSDVDFIQEYGQRRGASKNQIKRAINLLHGYKDYKTDRDI